MAKLDISDINQKISIKQMREFAKSVDELKNRRSAIEESIGKENAIINTKTESLYLQVTEKLIIKFLYHNMYFLS